MLTVPLPLTSDVTEHRLIRAQDTVVPIPKSLITVQHMTRSVWLRSKLTQNTTLYTSASKFSQGWMHTLVV
jgi:hypothetical protein